MPNIKGGLNLLKRALDPVQDKALPLRLPRARLAPEYIDQQADRVARQMLGEHVVSGKPKETFNLAGRSKKESDRVKNLEYKLKPIGTVAQETPYAPRKGDINVAVPGDQTISDTILESIEGTPIGSVQQGGARYGLGQKHLDEPEFWKSNEVPAKGIQGKVDRLQEMYEPERMIGSHLAMGQTANNFAMHFADANLRAIDWSKASPKKINVFDNIIAGGYKDDKTGERVYFPNWPGLADPDAAMLAMKEDSNLRKWFNNRMKVPSITKPLDLPNGLDIQYAITEPNIRDLEINMTGLMTGKLKPGALVEAAGNPHNTYTHRILGEAEGAQEVLTPFQISHPDAAAHIASTKRPSDFTGTIQKVFPHQLVDEQYLDDYGRYRERIKKLTGKKDGGSVDIKAADARLAAAMQQRMAKGGAVDIEAADARLSAAMNHMAGGGLPKAIAKGFKKLFADDVVNGMRVRKDIPNTSSIGASLSDYSTHGLQEVPMSAFQTVGKPKYYSVQEEKRTKELARQIQENKELNPLIVVKDAEGHYILEGGHRFDAVRELDIDSFPALMVHDLKSLGEQVPVGKAGGGLLKSAAKGVKRLFNDDVLPAAERETNKAKFLEDSAAKKRLYHGTGRDIQTFDKSQIKRPMFGEGFHLAESPALASFYAKQHKEGQNVMPVHAAIKKPFVLNDMSKWYDIPGNTDAEKTAWIKSQGFDGIKYRHGAPYDAPNESGIGYVAFEPNQIKSATGNRGTYDINEADIGKATGGAVTVHPRVHEILNAPPIKLGVGGLLKGVGKKLADNVLPAAERETNKSAVKLGDKVLPVTMHPIEAREGNVMTNVNPQTFDKAFKKTQWQYVGSQGEGGIGERYKNFGEFAQTAPSMNASNVSVNKAGVVTFGDGRHRYAYLRDQGVDSIPMSMDKESIENAKLHGLLSEKNKAHGGTVQRFDDGGVAHMDKGGDPLDEFSPPRYRSAGRRPESQNDRKASANMPVNLAGNIVAGVLGVPGRLSDIKKNAKEMYEEAKQSELANSPRARAQLAKIMAATSMGSIPDMASAVAPFINSDAMLSAFPMQRLAKIGVTGTPSLGRRESVLSDETVPYSLADYTDDKDGDAIGGTEYLIKKQREAGKMYGGKKMVYDYEESDKPKITLTPEEYKEYLNSEDRNRINLGGRLEEETGRFHPALEMGLPALAGAAGTQLSKSAIKAAERLGKGFTKGAKSKLTPIQANAKGGLSMASKVNFHPHRLTRSKL